MVSQTRPLQAAIVGLGFGAEFIPIYQRHPLVEIKAICRRNAAKLNSTADAFGIDKRYTNYEELLADSSIDFVHINSPIADHAWMSIEALLAGKHVMCTVPMATSVAECEEICRIVAETGLKYMMAETVVYSREFLFIREMYESGEFGEIQYLQASHPQDMDGWPEYWQKMVPMHYATHVVSPVLGLMDSRAEFVSCFGSGRVRDAIRAKSGNSFAVESCHVKLAESDVTGHVWRFLYDTARQYRESFDVYGTKQSFEWSLVEGQSHVLHTAKRPEPEVPRAIEIPDFAHLLPEEVRPFTRSIVDAEHLSFLQGSGHGGSHPHMVNEFVQALLDDRDPWPNAERSANWTSVGILAHESALAGGATRWLPKFTLEKSKSNGHAAKVAMPHFKSRRPSRALEG